jgi:hypothetical protein
MALLNRGAIVLLVAAKLSLDAPANLPNAPSAISADAFALPTLACA